MRYLIALFFVYTLSTQCQAALHSWKYLYVVDGDTILFEALWMPSPLKKVVSVRLPHIDTAERRGKCEEERILADRATQFVKAQLKDARIIQVSPIQHDKFGGRLIADVYLDGKSLSQTMLEMGYAKPYEGGRKEGWCTTVKVEK